MVVVIVGLQAKTAIRRGNPVHANIPGQIVLGFVFVRQGGGIFRVAAMCAAADQQHCRTRRRLRGVRGTGM